MSSICSFIRLLVPQWGNRNSRISISLRLKRKVGFITWAESSTSRNDVSVSVSKHNATGYDSSEELFGLGVELHPRNVTSNSSKPRSWFGPNGQYIRELPCPSCRGRGYTQCTECGIERSRIDCPQCNGKGIKTCHQCMGDCVIWQESIDEQPWEKARSISPLKVKEDDEVDNLDIKLDVRRKTKRVYQSQPPEVGLKISRSLKLNDSRVSMPKLDSLVRE